jgi:RNA polymerase sigma factor (sigma-70 family)
MSRTRDNAVDELLVLQCQDGSRAAFEKLVRRWQRPLWRYALCLTGRSDAAWEVVQEAWLGIVKGIGRLDDPALFRPWAYRIVRNRSATFVRKAQRDRARSSEADPGGLRAEERVPEGGQVQAALARLPGELRAVLTLHYLDELPVRAIAAALLIPEGTVKSRLHTARQRLREMLERNSHG